MDSQAPQQAELQALVEEAKTVSWQILSNGPSAPFPAIRPNVASSLRKRSMRQEMPVQPSRFKNGCIPFKNRVQDG